MTALPIPFVVAFLLVLLAVSNQQRLKQTASGRTFTLVLYLYAASTVMIGLRWSLDMVTLLPFAATLSVAGIALLYLAFRSLERSGPVVLLNRDWVHIIPTACVAVTMFMRPMWVEIVLISAKLAYSILLIRLARRTPESLQLVRLTWLNNTQRALWWTASLVLFSIVLDVAISLDFIFFEGRHAANLVGFVNMVLLLALGWACAMAGQGRVSDGPPSQVAQTETSSDEKTDTENKSAYAMAQSGTSSQPISTTDITPDIDVLIEKLNSLLIDERLYADSNLNLQKLARKAGLPSRTISRAVNTHYGQNISQWVNVARINAVCDQLKNTDISVSEAMLEAGFLTKSNFNREFRRLKGCSPSKWRNSC